MKTTTTKRGFSICEFIDRNGQACNLQKSSIATEDCVWLGLEDANPIVLHGDAKRLGVVTDATCGWVEYPIPTEVSLSTRMHLTKEQAYQLSLKLLEFAQSGEFSD